MAQLSSGDGHRYQLVDRTGRPMGDIPATTLNAMIRQGRLFRSDQVSKDGGRAQTLGSVREFAEVFDEVNPPQIKTDALRGAPEFAGDADQINLARAFVRIYRGRHNGRLFVCGKDAEEKVVIFRDGVPVNATSNIKDEWLGQVLRNQGLIDQATFDEAVASTQADGPRLGEVLVEKNKISARQLYRALAVQAMDRLLKLFQRGGTYHFVLDESAAQEEILLLAGPRDVLETCLYASISPARVTELLSQGGDPVLRVEVPEDLAEDLNDGDRTVLTFLEERRPLSTLLPQIADALRLTTAEARARVLFLKVFDCVHAGDPGVEAGEARLAAMQAQNYFDMLDIRRGSTPAEVEEAYQDQLVKVTQLTGGKASHTAEQIHKLLERARDILLDPDQRPLYERALQLGIDFDQPEAQTQLRHEMLLNRGRGLMAQQSFAEAAKIFDEAAQVLPDDPETEAEAGLAHFMASDRTGRVSRDARRRAERALFLGRDMEITNLVVGRIQRLTGDETAAEASFKRVLQISPGHQEAETELRSLQGRLPKHKRKKPGAKGTQKAEKRVFFAAGIALALTSVLYVGANVVPGGAKVWPDVGQVNMDVKEGHDPVIGQMNRGSKLRLNYSQEKLVEAALRMGADAKVVADKTTAISYLLTEDFTRVKAVLRDLRDIPQDEQFMGSTEYYYDSADPFWWLRRFALLIMGLLGMVFINRERPNTIPWLGERSGVVVAAPVYGIVVGFMSNAIQVASGDAAAYGMVAFHVLAEQVFFIWFVARAMINGSPSAVWARAGACVCVGLLYGLYHLSYYAMYQLGPTEILIQVLQIGFFAGGAYALLAWRSGGVLASFLAHFAVSCTMMVKSILTMPV